MLLIIVLGLIAKLTSGSGDCEIGTQDVKYFDYYKFSGPRPWYWLLHTPNNLDDDMDCPINIYENPEGNISTAIGHSYSISKHAHFTTYGNVTNWKSTGHWEEIYKEPYFVSVRAYVIAVDYDRYAIVKYCCLYSNKPNAYVLYRSQHPDKATVKDVLKKLKQNKIDVSQLVEYGTDHCQ